MAKKKSSKSDKILDFGKLGRYSKSTLKEGT